MIVRVLTVKGKDTATYQEIKNIAGELHGDGTRTDNRDEAQDDARDPVPPRTEYSEGTRP